MNWTACMFGAAIGINLFNITRMVRQYRKDKDHINTLMARNLDLHAEIRETYLRMWLCEMTFWPGRPEDWPCPEMSIDDEHDIPDRALMNWYLIPVTDVEPSGAP